MFARSVIATAGIDSSRSLAMSGLMVTIPSLIENSVCSLRCAKGGLGKFSDIYKAIYRVAMESLQYTFFLLRNGTKV